MEYFPGFTKVTSLKLEFVAGFKIFVDATAIQLVISSDFVSVKITQVTDYVFTERIYYTH